MLLKQMLAMLVMTAALWGALLFARVVTTPVLVLLWLSCAALLGMGLWHRAKRRRRVWLNAYLLEHSVLTVGLRGGLLMALWQACLALSLTLFLLLLLIRNDAAALWPALLVAALALPPLSYAAERILRAHFVPLYRHELASHAAVSIIALVLCGYVLWFAYNESYPELQALSLEQAVWSRVLLQEARSPALQLLLELAAAVDGASLWLAQRLLPAPAQSLWQGLGWILLLARDALFVWSYMLLCRGVLSVCGGAMSAAQSFVKGSVVKESVHVSD